MKKVVACFVCAAVTFLAVFFDVFSIADQMVEDTLYHNAGNVNGDIRIIKIDDHTMNELGDFSEWDRSVYARLIETLCVSEEIRPAVIGFDILFTGERDEESDQWFANACAEYGNVVSGMSYVFTREMVTDEEGKLITDAMTVKDQVVSYDALRKVTKEGFVNALMDKDDGVIRSAFLYFDEADGVRSKSFCSVVYENYMKAVGREPDYPVDDSNLDDHSILAGWCDRGSICCDFDGALSKIEHYQNSSYQYRSGPGSDTVRQDFVRYGVFMESPGGSGHGSGDLHLLCSTSLL